MPESRSSQWSDPGRSSPATPTQRWDWLIQLDTRLVQHGAADPCLLGKATGANPMAQLAAHLEADMQNLILYSPTTAPASGDYRDSMISGVGDTKFFGEISLLHRDLVNSLILPEPSPQRGLGPPARSLGYPVALPSIVDLRRASRAAKCLSACATRPCARSCAVHHASRYMLMHGQSRVAIRGFGVCFAPKQCTLYQSCAVLVCSIILQ